MRYLEARVLHEGTECIARLHHPRWPEIGLDHRNVHEPMLAHHSQHLLQRIVRSAGNDLASHQVGRCNRAGRFAVLATDRTISVLLMTPAILPSASQTITRLTGVVDRIFAACGSSASVPTVASRRRVMALTLPTRMVSTLQSRAASCMPQRRGR